MKKTADTIGRRGFIGGFAAFAFSLMAGTAAFIGGSFLYPVKKKKPLPLFICLSSEILMGKPVEAKDPEGRMILLIRNNNGNLAAIGTVCSHLGCTIYYRPQKNIFECPCHQGVFDKDGNPVSGPPEMPLARYETIERDEKVFIQFS
jgi:cytochrome b6-f complex iron-sulfur subunit